MPANKLPVVKDPELEKRRPEAKAHDTKCESERKELEEKEKTSKSEQKKKQFTDKGLGGKIADFKAMCAEIKSVAKERNSKSVANIKKGKELFEYPMKPKPGARPAPEIPVK
jgi:hypothetical protein